MAPRAAAELLSKRGLGWLSWRVRRRHRYQPRILEALLRDLQASPPDHLAITGDLTNVSLPSEFVAAHRWLSRLGSPGDVTAIPGNHDAYVAVPEATAWSLWNEYLASDAEGEALREELFGGGKDSGRVFPSVRRVGPLALVGLSSAVPTRPLLASGRIGAEQLQRLEALLRELGARGLWRVVLVHHPPEPGVVSRRRALDDAPALCDVLRRSGAELVLHGHMHRTRIGSLPGPHADAAIPVVGVRSASHVEGSPERVARYHLYTLDPEGGAITLRAREYDPSHDAFRDADEEPIALRS